MMDQIAELSRRRLAVEARMAATNGREREALADDLAKVTADLEQVTRAYLAAGGDPFVKRGPRIVAAQARKQPTQAKKLVDLAQHLYDVIEDQYGQAVAVSKAPPRTAIPLAGKGGALTKRLKLEFFDRYGTAPSATAVAGAIDVLEARAAGGARIPVHTRVARTADGLVIDLGDPEGRAVVVRDGEWKVMKSPPRGVLFKRGRMTAALPKPRKGGKLDGLRDLINVTDEGWDLIRAWLVLAWMPDVPVPILAVTGQQGAGKSVLGRVLVSLVDPSPAPLRAPPRGRDMGEWRTVAAASRVIGLDNVSRINEEFSDALCRAVTGEGGAKRQLYSDEDLIVQSFLRAVLLTSIDPGALKGDLGERLMPVELRPLRRRRGEAELAAEFERRKPYLLGALLDVVAEVLARPVRIDEREQSRMADAANVIAATDRVLGSSALAAYREAQSTVTETVLESDPLAAAVVAFMRSQNGDGWKGEPQDLYEQLALYRGEDGRNWPANARGMSGRLRRLAPALREAYGIELGRVHIGHRRGVRLRWRNGRPPGRRPARIKARS